MGLWEMCHGYASLNLNTLPSNLNIVWDTTIGSSGFVTNMPGFSLTPRNVWNLLGEFDVRYERTWINRAFSGVSSFSCPSSDQVWLFNNHEDHMNGKHLMAVTSQQKPNQKIFPRNRDSFQASKNYLAEQQAIYEAFKDHYNRTKDIHAALHTAWYKSCLTRPALTEAQAQLFTPMTIRMMHLEDECEQGFCVDLCYSIMHNETAMTP